MTSFKQADSDTMPLRHRSDFKQALSTLERLQQVSHTPMRHEVRLPHGGIGKVHGGLLVYHSESQEGDAPSIE